MNKFVAFILLGVVFAGLWASASVAAKIGVTVMEPLMLFQHRFFLAGILLLLFSRVYEKWRWPNRKEWINLSIFGFLNVTLYLSLFVLAIDELAAGIGSLSTSLSPLMMSMIGSIFYKKKVSILQKVGLFLGISGIWLAVMPLLGNNYATVTGLVLLTVSMLSYSIAAFFYSEREWTLPRFAINGWQVFLGGLFMLPVTLFLKEQPVVYTSTSIVCILWLAIPVSIVSVNIWLKMLKIDPMKASYFLLLCPIFGFIFASVILGEPFTWHTMVGLILALVGMYLGQKSKKVQ
jgi:probable blue pigment (indigoidine) exporter